MAGAAAIVVLLLVIPVGFLVSMTAVAGLLGAMLTKDASVRHEGSELVELNR
jgi:energy-converting hydrogenase Eha subunit A